MVKKYSIILFILILTCLYTKSVLAYEVLSNEAAPVSFAVGFEVASPGTVGISGTYNINEPLAIQGIISYPGALTEFSGVKLLYRFFRQENYNFYLYGLTGRFKKMNEGETLEVINGDSIGIGLEYSAGAFSDNIRNSLELGAAQIPLTEYDSTVFLSYSIRIYF